MLSLSKHEGGAGAFLNGPGCGNRFFSVQAMQWHLGDLEGALSAAMPVLRRSGPSRRHRFLRGRQPQTFQHGVKVLANRSRAKHRVCRPGEYWRGGNGMQFT